MKNFRKRAITSVIFAIVLISCVFYSQYTFLALFLFISLVSLHEFMTMNRSDLNLALYWFTIWLGLLGYVAVSCFLLKIIEPKLFLLLIFLTSSLFIIVLFQKSKSPLPKLGNAFTGLIYIIIPFCTFIGIGFSQSENYNYQLTLGFLFLLWANDTGAYLTGVQFGKTKLMESISPKKTWEGFAGGMISAMLISQIISYYFTNLLWYEWLIIAVLIAVFGTIGDLVESMFKRSMHTKDSGTLLPGHGGLLDRFDGLLMAAPFVYIYLLFIIN